MGLFMIKARDERGTYFPLFQGIVEEAGDICRAFSRFRILQTALYPQSGEKVLS